MSPTISSSRSSMVTNPAVPPYSSSTTARCTFSRFISASTSSTSRVPGTKSGGSHHRANGGPGLLPHRGEYVLGVHHAGDIVEGFSVHGIAGAARLGHHVGGGLDGELLLQRHHLGAGASSLPARSSPRTRRPLRSTAHLPCPGTRLPRSVSTSIRISSDECSRSCSPAA